MRNQCPECSEYFESTHFGQTCTSCRTKLSESYSTTKKVPMTDVDPSGYGKNRNQNSSTTGARDSASLWLDYPTLSVLKIIFQIVGILALIGSFIVGAQTSSFTVFLSAAMGGLTFLAVPEIILILVRIESHLRELKDK